MGAASARVKRCYEAKAMPSIATTFLNMVPTNPINAAATDNILQIIVFALFISLNIWLNKIKNGTVAAKEAV